MFQRVKHFMITFVPSAIFIFAFYYISTKNMLDSILLALVGAAVIAGIVSFLMPFIRNRN